MLRRTVGALAAASTVAAGLALAIALPAIAQAEDITIPVAHHDGNYFADAETLARLNGEGRVAFRYLGNPNGSVEDIAGILSDNRRVLGMMPHPERAVEAAHGNTDGAALFDALTSAFATAG